MTCLKYLDLQYDVIDGWYRQSEGKSRLVVTLLLLTFVFAFTAGSHK